jgi:hypothetical protein
MSTTLTADITDVATSLTVAIAAGFPTAPFDIQIEAERMTVTVVAGTTFTVTRATGGTAAAAHASGVAVNRVAYFTTGTDNHWSNVTNWSEATLPGPTDFADITGQSVYLDVDMVIAPTTEQVPGPLNVVGIGGYITVLDGVNVSTPADFSGVEFFYVSGGAGGGVSLTGGGVYGVVTIDEPNNTFGDCSFAEVNIIAAGDGAPATPNTFTGANITLLNDPFGGHSFTGCTIGTLNTTSDVGNSYSDTRIDTLVASGANLGSSTIATTECLRTTGTFGQYAMTPAGDLAAGNILTGKTILGVVSDGSTIAKTDVVASTDVRNTIPRWTGATGSDVGTCHVPTAAQVVSDVAVDVSDTGTAPDYATIAASIAAISALLSSTVITGAVSGTSGTTTVIPTNLSSAVDNFCKDAIILFTSGIFLGQRKRITAYDHTGTHNITVASPFIGGTGPANADTFVILGFVDVE